jgi:hypothetical protein
MFSEEVCNKIGNYVYRLIDPRNGETFYIGKGKDNRVFQHAIGTLKSDEEEEEEQSTKNERICEIKNAGLEVIHIIHRHEIPDQAIFHVEAALIDSYAGLSNEQGGHGSNSYGPMHTAQIIEKYSLPDIDWEPEEKLVIININNLQNRSDVDEIYNQVKGHWRISLSRAQKTEFVIAAVRGVAIGIFTAEKWMKSKDYNNRCCFKGMRAPAIVWDKFIGHRGKRLTNDGMKHIQNPIRYWNV